MFASINSFLTGGNNIPPIGASYEGGYFGGQILYPTGQKYNLVVSPRSTGQSTAITYGSLQGSPIGATSTYDGLENTNILVASESSHYAAEFCDNLTIGGYSDWYMPAQWELEVLFWYLKSDSNLNFTVITSGANPYAVSPEPISTAYTSSSPAQTSIVDFQTGGSQIIGESSPFTYNDLFWTSTEYAGYFAWYQYMGSTQPGKQQYEYKNTQGNVRAIRRVAV